jgi:uncharacterized protein DUF4157/nucleic acid/nucleotide deaminase of polymorphic system toxin
MNGHSIIQIPTLGKSTFTAVTHGLLQRCTATTECDECRKKREGTLQRAAVNSSPVGQVPPIVHEVLRSPGQPLDAQTRAFMEPRFVHDFSDVRVHTDAKAAESARAVNALAYTVGRNVVFEAGQYAPGTTNGQRLLAHELTHTIQQTHSHDEVLLINSLKIGDLNDVYEQEAENKASHIITGYDVNAMQMQSQPTVAMLRCQPKPTIPTPARHGAPSCTPRTGITEYGCYCGAGSSCGGGLNCTPSDKLDACCQQHDIDYGNCSFGDRYNPLSSCYAITRRADARLADCARGLAGIFSDESETYRLNLISIFGASSQTPTPLSKTSPAASHVAVSSPQPNIANGSNVATHNIAAMATSAKISEALTRSISKIPGQTSERIRELLTPESLATIVTFTSLYIASQLTPAGWIADIIAAGLLIATVAMTGSEVVEVVKHLIAFGDKASSAVSEKDLNEAADHFAIAVTKVGIDVVAAILLHKAGKAAKPYLKPSQGAVVVDMVTPDGAALRVPVDVIPDSNSKGTTETKGSSSTSTTPQTSRTEPSSPSLTNRQEGSGQRGREVGSTRGFRLGKTAYGEDVLSQLAQRLRVKLGLRRGGNVAVFEFENIPDNFRSLVARLGGRNVYIEGNRMAVQNVSGSAHSEQLAHELITTGRRAGNGLTVKRIYTEFNPCTDTCLPLIQRNYPTAEVTYSFIWELWGRETPDRNFAIDALFSRGGSSGSSGP